MIKAVSACLAALLLAAPAVADPCLEEIAALFDDGGAMDPFARPPLHQFTQEYDTDGNPTRLNEALFGKLKAPVMRLGAPACPVPFSKPLETAFIPGQADIEAALRRLLK